MLKTVSTATVCTALYKRGLRNQFIQDVYPLNPGATDGRRGLHVALHPGARGPDAISVFEDRPHPQRKAVEDCPSGAVLVTDSRKDPRAAFAAPS